MAMAGSAGGSSRRRRRARRGGAINEINMTPFIDVMLVLLIIFMVAAPMMSTGVPLDLPQTKAAPLNMDAKPVTLSIRSTGQVFMGEAEVNDQTFWANSRRFRSKVSKNASFFAATKRSITVASLRSCL